MKINEVIDSIISDAIKNIDWKCPFVKASNPVTPTVYRGINRLVVNAHLQQHKLTSPYFLTFNQVKAKKGMVKKGAKGCPIVNFSLVMKDKDGKITKDKKLAVSEYFSRSYSKVFNLDFIEGIEFPLIEKEFLTDKKLDSILENYCKELNEIQTVIGQAFYIPQKDIVGLPKPKFFTGIGEYYSTFIHELVHSTGHPSRLKRFKEDESTAFGSESYSKEELVAELGAMLSLEDTTYADKTRENSLAYLASWYKKIKNPREVATAFSKAEEAKKLIFKN